MSFLKRHQNKKISTITKISDELWDNIFDLLPNEKPKNTEGCPVIPFRKVLNGIYMFLEPDANGRCFQKNLVRVLHIIDDFNNGFNQTFKKIWVGSLKKYDSKKGIKWM